MTTQLTANGSISDMKELWTKLFPSVPAPDEGQWALWFLRHSPVIVREGIAELGIKYRKLNGQMDSIYMGKFASSVMNRLSRELDAKRQCTGGQTK